MKKFFYATAIALALLGTVTSCGSKSSSSSSIEATDGDWDKVIDAYEEAMDAYVDAVKAASSGDADAMKKLAEAEAEMAKYASELDNVDSSQLTEEQANRIKDIAAKAAAAASEMSSSAGNTSTEMPNSDDLEKMNQQLNDLAGSENN